ncbi:hypothetical protein EDB19DRAFT_1628274 [Suillus lakei]|nr:hypothetical protein EDB19DRAFT_1628274 [Suillus lakei]
MARKEDRKKNKHKFTAILATRIPNEVAITSCSYALWKMDKGKYMELWYFTNDGLEEANCKKTVDNDAMIMSTLADGSSAWVTAASTRNARAILNDKDLPFEEFCQAYPHMLMTIEETDWPEDRIRMMAKFWRNIQVHRFCSLRAEIGKKALLTYQAKQRKHWHVTVKTSVSPYDLSLVNEKVLKEMRERVYWEEREKRDNTRNYKVSFSVHQDLGCANHSLHFPNCFFKLNLFFCHMPRIICSIPHATCYTPMLHASCHMPRH